jgi:hypothetical protein
MTFKIGNNSQKITKHICSVAKLSINRWCFNRNGKAYSKILPRFQNLRTNVNISVTLQDSSLEKLEKLSSFNYLPSTNFQTETAATAFLCGYLIMKITKAIHGCDYCLSHLQDSNSKKKIPLLELIYY